MLIEKWLKTFENIKHSKKKETKVEPINQKEKWNKFIQNWNMKMRVIHEKVN